MNFLIIIIGFIFISNSNAFENLYRTFGALRDLRCGATSAYAITNIRSPTGQTTDCVYTIRANTARVCQLRIDFDLMISQPSESANQQYPHCANDALSVNGVEICGTNLGQHIYIPWDVQNITNRMEIRIRLANRAQNPLLPPPRWDLKVTQIECVEKSILARHNELRAPEGCLQYFTESTGFIESFNFNSQNGPYLGNQNYAICVRRPSPTNSLRLLPQFFEMSSIGNGGVVDPNVDPDADPDDDEENGGEGYDEDCLARVPTAQGRADFLSIRDGTFRSSDGTDLVANRFCGTSITRGTPVITSVPGPFVLHFNSDQRTSPEEKGFRFQYTFV